MGTARPVVAVAKHAALADRTSALLYEGMETRLSVSLSARPNPTFRTRREDDKMIAKLLLVIGCQEGKK